jgi:hypothetical protein
MFIDQDLGLWGYETNQSHWLEPLVLVVTRCCNARCLVNDRMMI